MAELTGWHFPFFLSSWHRKKRDFDQNHPLSIHVPSTVISSVNEELRHMLGNETHRRIHEDEPRGKGKGGQVAPDH